MSPLSALRSTSVYTLYVSITGSCSYTLFLLALTFMKRSELRISDPAVLIRGWSSAPLCILGVPFADMLLPVTFICTEREANFRPLATTVAEGILYEPAFVAHRIYVNVVDDQLLACPFIT